MVTSSAGETRSHVVYTTYTAMVKEAGGTPVVLVPIDANEVSTVLDRLDGLVLTGGGDIDPSRYGGAPIDALYGVDPVRDTYELALATEAASHRMPVLAICRGMQVMNVALGGSLIADIGSQVEGAAEHRKHGVAVHEHQHQVEIEPDSTTAAALGETTLGVNTIHHQAVDRIADDLRATAWSPDGIVEAAEPADDSWPMWAVQWHPEYLGAEDAPSLRLFQAFVAAASTAAVRG